MAQELCPTITGPYDHDTCRRFSSGVHSYYIGSYSAATTWSINSDFVVTGATQNPTFQRISLKEGTGEFLESLVAGDGANDVTQSAKIVLYGHHASATKYSNILKNGQFVLIVKGRDGNFKLLGIESPLIATEGSGTMGVAAGERNAYEITISCTAVDFAPTIDILTGIPAYQYQLIA